LRSHSMSEISRILKAAVPQGKALAWLLGAGAPRLQWR
jgi:hypothetical protein